MYFQVDDEDLQDEPLQITVLDHDTYSANDAIGKVYIDIDPLLYSEAATVISGWFPIYDTIHGRKCFKSKSQSQSLLLTLKDTCGIVGSFKLCALKICL